MIELKPSDLRTPAQLKALGFPADEVVRYIASSSDHAELLRQLDIANDKKDWDTVLNLEPQVNKLAKYLKYLGRHPKSIPITELQELAKGADDATEAEFRDKITNPARGIRAFCVMCMGGNPTYVRECEAVSCPIWPFRTGKNPLFGKVLPPIDFDATIDPTEPEEVEEETENQDAD